MTDIAFFPYFIAVFGWAYIIATLVERLLSRRFERDADLYALHLTGNVAAFRSAMVKTANLNLHEAKPSFWQRAIISTHPSIAERLHVADKFATSDAGGELPGLE